MMAESDLGVPAEAAPGVVHVVDDDEAVRWAVAALLRSVGIATETHASGPALLDALATPTRRSVGCVLTDVRMPELDGLELLRHLAERSFRRPVIVMTAHGDVSMAVRAMKAGAFDFIEKPFDEGALLATVRAALGAPEASGVHPEASAASARVAGLSPREREVLTLAMEGKPNKVIARELGLSPRTVEVHRMRLMARLGVESLAEAVRLAVLAELAGSRDEPLAGGG